MQYGYLLAMLDAYKREERFCKPERRDIYRRIINELETVLSLSESKGKHFKEDINNGK